MPFSHIPGSVGSSGSRPGCGRRAAAALALLALGVAGRLEAAGTAYSAADLGGIWHAADYYAEEHLAYVGFSRMQGSFGGPISYVFKETGTGSFSGSLSSAATIGSADGLTTVRLWDPWVGASWENSGYMTASKSAIVIPSRPDGSAAPDDPSRDYGIVPMVRQGSDYAGTDLGSGTWYLASYWLDRYRHDVGYTRGTGSFGQTFELSEESTTEPMQSFSLKATATLVDSRTGKVRLGGTGVPRHEGYLSAAKDVILMVDDLNNSYNLIALVRQGDSYSAADLEGVWHLTSFWVPGSMGSVGITYGSGVFGDTFVLTDERPGAAPSSYGLPLGATLDAAGAVQLSTPGAPSRLGYMNASKDLIVWIGRNREGALELIFLVRQADLARLPEVAVSGNGMEIAAGASTPWVGDHTDFGSTVVGTAVARTYTVSNPGGSPLVCGEVSVPLGFTLTEGLSPSVPAGGSDTFTVQLDAPAAGTYAGEVRFANNDADETPFSFRITGAVAPGGALAVTDATEVARQRGWWNLSGTYATHAAGVPLALNLVHDTRGRVTGTATFTLAKAAAFIVPVKGVVKGVAGSLTMVTALSGADPSGPNQAALRMRLALDVPSRQLRGVMTGSVTVAGVTTPAGADLALALPPPTDGTWTLLFQLAQGARGARRVSGSALLSLANAPDCAFAVAGDLSGAAGVVRLTGAPHDPAAKGITIAARVVPQASGQARLAAFLGRGYGQVLGW